MPCAPPRTSPKGKLLVQVTLRNGVAWGLLLVISLLLHLWQLDVRTFHSDEAVHARLAYDLYAHGHYRYDPTYHGPLLYYLTAAIYGLFGDSDFTARLVIALAGVGMLWVAWRLRQPFGGRAAWWAGVLVTISPLCLYYGRFLRMDLLEMLTASVALVSLYAAFRRPDRLVNWVWTGVFAGLAFATKENAYITAVLLLITLTVVALAFDFRGQVEAARRSVAANRFGLAVATISFAAVALVLYTAFLNHPGDWDFPVRAVRHWAHQHDVERLGGPWWFYLLPLIQYEFLTLSAASVWVIRRRRLRPVEAGLFIFGAGSIVVYAYLGEKAPWLGVHQVWAFIPLAAAQLAHTFGPRGAWWSRAIAGTGIVLTLLAAITASFVLDEIHPGMERVESLHYVQTSPGIKRLVGDIRQQVFRGERPAALVSGEATWPLAWYLRHDPVHWGPGRETIEPPIVVIDPGREESQCGAPCALTGYHRENVTLRSWWLPQLEKPGYGDLPRYLLTRRPWTPVGSQEVLVLRR